MPRSVLTSLRLSALAAVAVTAAACSRHANDYSAFYSVPPQGWDYHTALRFTPAPEDSLVSGRLDLAVRHTNNYPYRNLYLELSYVSPADSTRHCDTLNVELADAFGNWHGSGLGTSFQHRVTISPRFTVAAAGTPLRLRHVMRPDTVAQLEQIGLIFTSSTAQ